MPRKLRSSRAASRRNRRPLALESLERRQLLAAIQWNSDESGFWDDPANWSPQQVPGAGDDVTIDRPNANPMIFVRDSQTAGSLTSRESLAVTGGRLQVNGTSRIEAGALTLDASELAVGGTLTVAEGAQLLWHSGHVTGNGLINQGVVTLDGVGSGDTRLRTTIDNRATGVLEFVGAGRLFNTDQFGNSEGRVINTGLILKSNSVGDWTVDAPVDVVGGTIEAQSGRLKLTRSGLWRDGVLNAIAADAVVELADGGLLIGDFTGAGAGRVEMSGGTFSSFDGGVSGGRATLDFPDALLQWTGGTINSGGCGSSIGCGSTMVNAGSLTLSGPNDKLISGTGLDNRGTMSLAGTGKLSLQATLENQVDAVLALADGAALTGVDQFGNQTGKIVNRGTIRKSAGVGEAVIDPAVEMIAGTIESWGGRLRLTRSGWWQGGELNAWSDDAVVEIKAGAAMTGDFTGAGSGRVEFSDGNLASFDGGVSGQHATLDFPPDLFVWTGGNIGSGGCGSNIGCATTLVNAGRLQIEGDSAKGISASGLINEGTIVNSGAGLFGLNASTFQNRLGATYDHHGDGPFSGLDQFGNVGQFINEGTFRKSSGSGTIESTARFVNRATGAIEIDAGRWRLTRGGLWTGAAIVLAAGAGLDIASSGNDSVFLESGDYVGSGLGTIVHTGQLQATSGAVPIFDFPEGMFRWRGGNISGRLINEGHLTLDAPTAVFSSIHFTNHGAFLHAGAGDYVFSPTSTFENQGLYELSSDADLVVPNSQSVGTMQFINQGTFRKSGGVGLSELRRDATQFGRDLQFSNTGVVEVLSGSMRIDRPIVQVSDSTLTGGEWHVGANATLTLAAHGNLTINQGHVILEGVNASFTNLTAIADNRGTFELLQGRRFDTVGSLVNSGRLIVGPGSQLTVAGALTQALSNPSGPSIGAIEVQIASRPRPNRFGRITVDGAAAWAGVFEARLVEGFGPVPGDEYDVLSYASQTGSFSTLIGVAPSFDLIETATTATLAVRPDVPTHDLLVEQVVAPATGRPGESTTISYTVRNLSASPTTATWIDSIYLSRDSSFDPSDRLIGRVQHAGGVGGLSAYTETLTTDLPGIVDGDYRVLVIADSRALVPDPERDNNDGVSASLLSVASTPLMLGVPLISESRDQRDGYFRIQLPAAGDVSFAAQFLAENQAEFYVRRGDVPTRTVYDWVANDPTELERLISISDPQAGPYYVLIHGREGSASGTPFALTAALRNLSLDAVSPSAGSRFGFVTISLDGLGFTDQAEVELAAGATVLEAVRVQVDSTQRLHATFDLRTLAVGHYDVRLRQGSDQVLLPQAFAVTSGRVGQLDVRVSAPGVVRSGRVGTVLVEYQNSGETDIPAPLLMFSGTNAEYRLVEQAEYKRGGLPILGINVDGPAAFLPPGARVTIPVQVRGIADISGDFRVDVLNYSDSIDWNSFKDNLQPPTVEADAWEAIFQNFRSIVGDTVVQWQMALGAVASLYQRTGEPTYDVDKLQQYLLAYSDQFGAISSRYRLGTWGRGRPDATTYEVTADPAGNLSFSNGGLLRFFLRQSDGSYRGMADDTATILRSAAGTTLIEPSGHIFQYRADGKLTSIDDVYGNRLSFTYDSSGRLTTISDANGDQQLFTYNAAGRVASMTDYDGQTTTYAYDLANEHLLAETNPQGTTTYTYVSGQGATREHALASVTTPDGVTTDFEYDELGRLVRQSSEGGALALEFTHPQLGEHQTRNALGQTTTQFVDARGQLVGWKGPLNDRTRMQYDARGNLTEMIGPDGARFTLSYDAQARITSNTDPLGQTELYAYAGVSSLPTLVRNAEGNTVQYVRDARNAPLEILYPDGSREQFTYDSAGRLTRETSRAGVTIEYEYDAKSQLTRSAAAGVDERIYEYDASRNLNSVTTAEGVTTLTHDAAGRVTRVTYPNGRYVEYGYDAAGRNALVRTSDGFEQRFEYDGLSRLIRVRDGSSALVVEYVFDVVGRVIRENRGNGSFALFTYDGANRVAGITYHDGVGAVSQQLTYAYDAVGRIASSTSHDGRTDYEYDAAGQLIRVTLPSGRSVEYVYDAAGNRIRTIDSGVVTEYLSNQLDQHTAIGDDLLAYDANGDLISRTGPGGTTLYEYNERRQLVRVAGPGGVWEYEYDAFGNRSATVHNGARTEFLNDPLGLASVLAEYNELGDVVARYTYGVGLASRIDGAGRASYYDYDATGNALQLTDDQGAVAERFAYLPFGERLTAAKTDYGFLGRSGGRDDGNGLIYLRARYYDPSQGRFTQPDPSRLQGGDVNRYRYAGNDPVNFLDASGYERTGLQQGDGNYRPSDTKYDYHNQRAGRVRAENPSIDFTERARRQLAEEAEERATMNAIARSAKPDPTLRLNDAPARPAPASAPKPPAQSPQVRVHDVPRYDNFRSRFAKNVRGSGALTAFELILDPNLAELTASGLHPNESPFGDAAKEHPDVEDARKEIYEDMKRRAEVSLACTTTSFILTTSLLAVSVPFLAVLGPFAPVALVLEGLIVGYLTKYLCWTMAYVAPSDPNEIIGPIGYGPLQYVAAEAPLAYTINFENKPTATAPAQEVVVTHQLDADLDWSSFEQGDIYFGDVRVPAPAHSATIDATVDATASVGSLVRVRGDVNRTTGLVTWIFTSIDPATGDLPSEPLAGFLPPNTAPPIGEGSIDFRVRRRSTATSGARIDAAATIVFDFEPPLDTAPIFHTLDAGTPTSAVATLPAVWTQLSTPVISWSGADEANGSGIRAYDVFVSTDGGPFVLWLDNTTLTSKPLDLPRGHAYSFYSVAADNVGHEESTPTEADAATFYLGPPWHNFARRLDVNGDGDVTPVDALLIINELNFPTTIDATNRLPLPPPTLASQRPFWDVDGDNFVLPLDALLVINRLNGGPEGEGDEVPVASDTTAAAIAAADWLWGREEEEWRAHRRGPLRGPTR